MNISNLFSPPKGIVGANKNEKSNNELLYDFIDLNYNTKQSKDYVTVDEFLRKREEFNKKLADTWELKTSVETLPRNSSIKSKIFGLFGGSSKGKIPEKYTKQEDVECDDKSFDKSVGKNSDKSTYKNDEDHSSDFSSSSEFILEQPYEVLITDVDCDAILHGKTDTNPFMNSGLSNLASSSHDSIESSSFSATLSKLVKSAELINSLESCKTSNLITPLNYLDRSSVEKTSKFEQSGRSSKNPQILYDGLAGKFSYYNAKKIKIEICIPCTYFQYVQNGDIIAADYSASDNFTLYYESDLWYVQGLAKKNEFSQETSTLFLCDPTNTTDYYTTYIFICDAIEFSSIFMCLKMLYEHCKSKHIAKQGDHQSVISGKFVSMVGVPLLDPLYKIIETWEDKQYSVYIPMYVFNTIHAHPEYCIEFGHMPSSIIKCNPGLSTNNVSNDGKVLNMKTYLYEFSQRFTGLTEEGEKSIIDLLLNIEDYYSQEVHEHAKKYSKWITQH